MGTSCNTIVSMGTPCFSHQFNLFCTHMLCASSSSPGATKYSSSICSNSLTRNMKFLGVISFLKAFPICAIPNGKEQEVESTMFLKLVNICWAVSGLKYA